PMADEAFLAGMIHDTGLVIALQQWPDKLRSVCKQAKIGTTDFCTLEREITGTDHQHLGMALAEQWKFPRTCQLVARYHHHPAARGDQTRMLAGLTYAPPPLGCCSTRPGFNPTAPQQKLDDAALAVFQIDRPLIDKTAANLDKLMDVASTLFG